MTDNTERAQVGWRFWLWWMLASAVVPSLVVAMVLVIYESLTDSDPQQQLVAAFLGIVLVLATITISQWLVLRRQIPQAGWWVVAGIVSLLVGLLAGGAAGGAAGFLNVLSQAVMLDADLDSGVDLVVFINVSIPLVFATFTIAQWLVLRRHVSRAGLWLLVPIVSLLVGTPALAILSGTIGSILGAGAGEIVNNSLGIVVYGAITGGVLVWLLRQPVTEEPSLPQDAA